MNQEQLVLEILQKNPQGVTNIELIDAGILRASALVKNLRDSGYLIKSYRSKENKSIWWYKLVGENKEVDKRSAYDKFAHVLYKNGFGDVAECLPSLLEEAEVTLRKKQGKFN